MKILVLAAVLVVFGVAVGSAGASDRYAGLTRSQAINTAKDSVIGLGIAFGKLTPTQAAKMRLELDKREPRATHSRCDRKPAWRVKWPDSDPIFVNRSGFLFC